MKIYSLPVHLHFGINHCLKALPVALNQFIGFNPIHNVDSNEEVGGGGGEGCCWGRLKLAGLFVIGGWGWTCDNGGLLLLFPLLFPHPPPFPLPIPLLRPSGAMVEVPRPKIRIGTQSSCDTSLGARNNVGVTGVNCKKTNVERF